MGQVIEFHEKFLKRLATVYLDAYDMHGYEAASEWHKRTLGEHPNLKAEVRRKIKEIAPLRGKVIKD